MSSPRLVLHHPSPQASPTALLPPMPAVTPARNLLKIAGQHTKEHLSRFKSSGLQTSSVLFSLVALFPCRTPVSLLPNFSSCCCCSPAPHLETSKSTVVLIKCLFLLRGLLMTISAAAFPHGSAAPAVGGGFLRGFTKHRIVPLSDGGAPVHSQ